MNFSVLVNAIIWAAEHKAEIAETAEAGIHLIRRVEHLCVHHKTTADNILVAADDMLRQLRDDGQPSANNSS